MKNINAKIALLVLTAASVLRLTAAALPEDWEVDLAAQSPQVFTLQRPRGETYELKAVLKRHGKPFEPAITNACIYWQTNGMENLYWSAPASVSNNVLRATWLPSMDPGATTVRGYIGDPGHIYAAAFQFRFIASPGPLPNALPLPVPVIDFAKVRVLNPPWSGGGGGVDDTNAVIDIIHATVDGAARPLPKYLHVYEANDSYTNEAAAYYRSRGDGKTDGGCSAVRSGGYLSRNFDFPFDSRSEFVVKMSAGKDRFASVGVAQVGTNLTEQMVTSGKPEFSARYKWLPGATVDGVNENGVVAEINVVDTPVTGWHTTGNLHPLAAVRWVLDNATNAQSAAEYIAANIRFPQGWTQNFHYMIADAEKTYIVENGTATDGDEYHEPDEPVTMTNFQLSKFPWDGMGMERFGLLLGGANITNAWYTRAYHRETNPPWVSDLRDVLAYTNDIYNAWASHPKEYFRGKTTNGEPWWQTVHTSVYDISNRVLRVAVQETDDWYIFALQRGSGVSPLEVRAIASEVVAPVASTVSSLQSSKADKSTTYTKSETDAKLAEKANKNGDSNEDFSAKDIRSVGTLSVATILCGDEIHADGDINGFGDDGTLHHLSQKANRAESGDADEIATLDADGNPTRSGIAKDDVATVSGIENAYYDAIFSSLAAPMITIGTTQFASDYQDNGRLIDSQGRHYAALSEIPAISATNPAFSNAVATVAKTVQPTTVRAYDSVRRCWWVLEIVNGVPTWTVED